MELRDLDHKQNMVGQNFGVGQKPKVGSFDAANEKNQRQGSFDAKYGSGNKSQSRQNKKK